MKQYLLMILALLVCADMAAANGVYNVRDYGAVGDGRTLDSPAINAAIEAAVRDGGGQVVLPAGTYLCGTIRLKSNIDLHLAAGCITSPSSSSAPTSVPTSSWTMSRTSSSSPFGRGGGFTPQKKSPDYLALSEIIPIFARDVRKRD